MKKILITFGIALVILVISCSKSEDENLQLDNALISSKALSAVNQQSLTEKKLMFSLLTPKEKKQFWDETLTRVLEYNKLNKQQVNLINKLKKDLTEEIFLDTPNNDKREVFKTIYATDFVNKAIKIFSPKEVSDIFYDAYYRLPGGGSFEDKDCDCNDGSMFTCGYQPSKCKEEKCTLKIQACGFLGYFDCDGLCEL